MIRDTIIFGIMFFAIALLAYLFADGSWDIEKVLEKKIVVLLVGTIFAMIGYGYVYRKKLKRKNKP